MVGSKSPSPPSSLFSDWRFWLPFFLAVASPFIAHRLDSQNQAYLFKLNQEQALKMDSLEQARREYALKLQTIEELEAAIAELKRHRYKLMTDINHLITATAVDAVLSEYQTLTASDTKTVADAVERVASDRVEALFAAQKVISAISKASVIFKHTWIDTEQRFTAQIIATSESTDFFLSCLKRMEDYIRPTIGAALKKAKDTNQPLSYTGILNASTSRNAFEIAKSYNNEFTAQHTADDALMTQVYTDCLRLLNPRDDEPSAILVSATPIPIAPAAQQTPRKTKLKMK